MKPPVIPDKEVRKSAHNCNKEEEVKVKNQDIVIDNTINNNTTSSSTKDIPVKSIATNQISGRDNFLKKAYVMEFKTYAELIFDIRGLSKLSSTL